jgi:hypothetical protein
MFKNSQRCKSRFKPKFARLKRLTERRDSDSKAQWFATADAGGNVQVRPR